MRWTWILGGVLAGAAGLLISRTVFASAYEHPAYAVERAEAGWEIRRYAPTLEAQVTVRGSFEGAMQEGFRRLAGYIFGKNEPAARVAMTVPVAARPLAVGPPGALQAQAADGGQWVVSFTMPTAYTLDTLPRPLDPGIRLVAVPGGRWAARAFSGRLRDGMADPEIAALQAALAAAGVVPAGPAMIAQYHPPWVPGPMRHNEVLVPLSADQPPVGGAPGE
jgi:hypothetical protein